MFIYPFRTFDEHFTRTALLLLMKLRYRKSNSQQTWPPETFAARQMFGSRDLVWPVINVVTRAICEYDYSDRRLQKQERKEIAKLIISDI